MSRCLMLLFALAGCGASHGVDAGMDGGAERDAGIPEGLTRSPDGTGFCCPVDYPTCDCAFTGGFLTPEEAARFDPEDRVFSVCGEGWVCDAHPDDWHETTDEHGCTVYDIGFTQCCNCPPLDAGM